MLGMIKNALQEIDFTTKMVNDQAVRRVVSRTLQTIALAISNACYVSHK